MDKVSQNKHRKIRKAVFPVAGLGTRLLPATKVMPKEMLTVVDRPLIQMVVDEARDAGIEDFIFVTGRNKDAIETHFDYAYELEDTLMKRGKLSALEQLAADRIPAGKASFTRQQKPLGLGHAVGCARALVGDEPFAVVLPDMIMHGKTGCLKQMVQAYNEFGGNIIASEYAANEELHKYGVLDIAQERGNVSRVINMVEKPKAGTAPSNQIISGRYILQPEVFDMLDKVAPGAGGEIQLTDAMQMLMKQQSFFGLEFEGKTYDCGDKLGFILANLAYGLSRMELSEELRLAAHSLLNRNIAA